MANTRPDVKNIPSDSWVNLNTLSGISVGTAMSIQNKAQNVLLLFISPTQPTASSNDGIAVYDFPSELSVVEIDSGEDIVWAKSRGGLGQVNVQEL